MALSENSWLVAGQRILDDFAHADFTRMPFRVAGFDFCEVQHLVDEARQALRFACDDAEKLGALREIECGIVVQDLGKRADRSQRRAQFVSHRRHEIVFQAVEFLQPLVGRAQFGRRHFELARFLLELAAVGERLGSFVEDVHHLVDAERLFLHDRCDH